MADRDNLPPYHSHRKVTRAQRNTAELARVQIRQNERQLRNQVRPAGSQLPPSVAHNQLYLAALNAEQIARSRQEEKAAHLAIYGQQRVTRKTAAKLRMNREDWPGDDRWETRALRLMYPENTIAVESTDNDRALAEIFAAEEDAEAFEDADPLPSADGTDDSDFHDAPHEKEMNDVLGEEEESSDENDVDGISEDDEDEASDEDGEMGESKSGAEPKIHQTLSNNRKVCVPRETYQQFSRRSSTSVKIRNNQMTKNAEALKTSGRRARKAVNLIPTDWEHYSITYKCIHGQEYKARGKGKRKHRKVRDTKCSAKLNVRVTATSYGDWELKMSASGVHNHHITKELWESYA
ncbi:hypothetical protein GN244_ATG03943 [Phytophthora infestans]|uniref:Uncharacterized protein n=1 Tax=Phytophthora infestans TaxID=4787 RepID=A0A833THU3_PHYIN|nr:hypothetical protein GN244_ATG03943 [Phytophthora infestans]